MKTRYQRYAEGKLVLLQLGGLVGLGLVVTMFWCLMAGIAG